MKILSKAYFLNLEHSSLKNQYFQEIFLFLDQCSLVINFVSTIDSFIIITISYSLLVNPSSMEENILIDRIVHKRVILGRLF